jgi:hypothetical protein
MPVILAIADGHGSSKYFRSHYGAQLAVKTALKVMQKFLSGQAQTLEGSSSPGESPADQADSKLDLSNPTVVSRMAEEQLPKLLSRLWLEAVAKDIEDRQLEHEELVKLEASDQEAAAAVRSAGKASPLAYGTTLLTVVVTASFILYVQIGDGDILIVTEAEEVYRPISGDDRLVANETTSLCAKAAWRDFRVKVQPTIDTEPPALILLSTDGYANSFRDEHSFVQVGPDLLRMVDQYGLEGIERKLETWLDEASQNGSGDDITLGVMKRLSGTDRDVIARNASAALAVGEDAHKRADEGHHRLDGVEKGLAEARETMEKRLEDVERSIPTITALQNSIATLEKKDSYYQSFDKRLRRFQWIAFAGLLTIIAIEVVFHIVKFSMASARQLSTASSTATATPTSEVSGDAGGSQPGNATPSPTGDGQSKEQSSISNVKPASTAKTLKKKKGTGKKSPQPAKSPARTGSP